MEYSFDIKHAEKYGLNEAIFLKNMMFWILKNKSNGKNVIDGRTWTYNSIKSYSDLFPFWTENQVRKSIKSLVNQGVIITGNHNKSTYDRTMWYAFKDESILTIVEMEVDKKPDGFGKKSKTNTDSKPDVKPYSNTDRGKNPKKQPFNPPSLDELKEYAISEKLITLDCEWFIKYYAELNWKNAKGVKMQSWKLTAQTWHRRNLKDIEPAQPPKLKPYTPEQLEEFRQFNERIKGRI